MRLLDKLLGRTPSQSNEAAPTTAGRQATVQIEEAGDLGQRGTVEFDGLRYMHLEVAFSPSDEYVALFRDGAPVFLFAQEELQFVQEIDRANTVQVADDGTVAIVDWVSHDGAAGKLHVFDAAGDAILTESFDSNLGPLALTPDGEYVAVSTFNPDCSTYIFDTSAGTQLAAHENLQGNTAELTFESEADGWVLYLHDAPDEEPLYGIDLASAVEWRSGAFTRIQRKEDLLSGDHDLAGDALIAELEDLYSELDDDETKPVARKLADIHWERAKSIKTEDGMTDTCWSHLNEAYGYYCETLPWSDGKNGVAKVRRLQGKQYLKEEKDAKALECFEEIAELEDEYEVQLLTDADKDKLDRLR